MLASSLVTDKVYAGNADADAAGDRRPQWVADEQRSALIVLISGRFHLELPGRGAVLAEPASSQQFAAGTNRSE